MTAHPSSNERLILFSDAIIAVTITLLALDIRLPDGDELLTDHQLIGRITDMGPRIFAYALSFLVIGSFWAAHRRRFESISRSHTGLIWLNFLFLLSLGLIPFATDVLAENDGLTATVLYAALVAVVSLLLASIGFFAHRRGLVDEHLIDPSQRQLLPSLGTAAVFVTSIPFAFISPDLAKLIWLLLIPLNIWMARRSMHALRGH
jgi:uncharacterized membrane protein